MALSSALFSGISGLTTLGSAMQIIGDNIANVNTVGFKASSFTFQDLLSQSVATMSGTAQVGRGTALGDISAGFDQGSFESTGSTTDLAIGGAGFFALREAGSTSNFYTRAGNFRFNNSGYLINPEGYVVQGWALDPTTGEDTGSVTDILLSSFTSSPSATTNAELIVNLDSGGDDSSAGSDTALSAVWDGQAASPIDSTEYEYQTTLKVYDSLGSSHDVAVYFDKAATPSTYEYIVTVDPTEDKRVGASVSSHAGLLARGTITFDAGSGMIKDIGLTQSNGVFWDAAEDEAVDLSNGFFTFAPTFIALQPMSVELNFGSSSDVLSNWTNSSLATTQFATASTTTFQTANGYGAGDLQSVNVDVDGVITGSYSNGALIALFRVALAKFQNLQGLKKEGANLFAETRDSGTATTSRPGTNGLGSIAPNSLEQSNVDIANELVKMITTQRGFQANSKIITVTDQMLAELIQLKR